VHMLSFVADANALRAAMEPDQRLAIIGGGYVSLEVVASAHILGADAVIIESKPRLLAPHGLRAAAALFLGLPHRTRRRDHQRCGRRGAGA